MTNRMIGMLLCTIVTNSLYAEYDNSLAGVSTIKEGPDWAKLKGAAEAYVKAFNGKDVQKMAELFAKDAVIHLTPEIKLLGRDAIKQYYQDIFTQSPKAVVGLEVVELSFPSSTAALERGMVVMDDEGELSTYHYIAELSKQDDGKWLIQTSKGVIATKSEADGTFAGLSVVIGNWVAKLADAKYSVSYAWDSSGNWIVGKGLYVSPESEPLHTTSRIGIDPATGAPMSWSFDSMGGFSQSSWEKVGDEWYLEASGVNAHGEPSKSSQIVSLNDSSSVNWAFMAREVGGVSADSYSMRLVKTPPQPFVSPKGVQK